MKAFQAYSAGGCKVTGQTPRAAAIAFFEQYPSKRKCSVIEGTVDGAFFTIKYGRASKGEWPCSWKDVTKKGAQELPGLAVFELVCRRHPNDDLVLLVTADSREVVADFLRNNKLVDIVAFGDEISGDLREGGVVDFALPEHAASFLDRLA